MSEDCQYCRFEKTEENCQGCWEGSNYRPKMTNADRIRAMTDEELAEIISSDWCAIVCEDTPICGGQCESRVLDWLKTEAEGEDNDRK